MRWRASRWVSSSCAARASSRRRAFTRRGSIRPRCWARWAPPRDGFGERWVADSIAFKPYACGTMTQPYVDCARRLAKRVDIGEIAEVVCEAADGTVHRLWEPLADKQRPPNAYAAKFSQPYCVAAGFVLGHAGLDAFTEERVQDARLRALAAKVRYVIDPANPYPKEFTGHVRVRLRDGREAEERQAHMRGGAHEPLRRADIEEKFRLNCAHGGWSAAQAERLLDFARRAYDADIDLAQFRT